MPIDCPYNLFIKVFSFYPVFDGIIADMLLSIYFENILYILNSGPLFYTLSTNETPSIRPLRGIGPNLYNTLGKTIFLTILILPIHGHKRFFHFLLSSSVLFSNMLTVFII